MKTSLILIIVCTFGLTLAASTFVNAICWYNGQTYQTGDVVGDYVCAEDGQWVLRD